MKIKKTGKYSMTCARIVSNFFKSIHTNGILNKLIKIQSIKIKYFIK